MARVFHQIKHIAYRNGAVIICAGDLFDKWNPPLELVNWAIDVLPKMYAIPGNHDLPSHRHQGEHRSAYGTLVRAGKLFELTNEPVALPWKRTKDTRNYTPGFIYGFPFGKEPVRPDDGCSLGIQIAVIHEYLWYGEAKYPGAKKKDQIRTNTKRFDGWDVVIVGDNHAGFQITTKTGTTILNCGSLMRRKSNEADYEPQIGLIHASGKVTTRKLDTSKDVLTELVHDDEEEEWDFSALIENLSILDHTSLDFRDALIAAIKEAEVSKGVKEAIMEALG